MDVSPLEAAITPRTKAIIRAHDRRYGGHAPPARDRGGASIPVIEDACQAVKSSLDERPAGSWGVIGAIFATPAQVHQYLGRWRRHDDERRRYRETHQPAAQPRSTKRDVIVSLGVNSRLDTVQAVVALHVLDQAIGSRNQRRTNAAFTIRRWRISIRSGFPRAIHGCCIATLHTRCWSNGATHCGSLRSARHRVQKSIIRFRSTASRDCAILDTNGETFRDGSSADTTITFARASVPVARSAFGLSLIASRNSTALEVTEVWRIPYVIPEPNCRRKGGVDARIEAILAGGMHVGGPEIEALEREIADYVGTVMRWRSAPARMR